MKGKHLGRGLKAITATLAVGLGMTACSRDYTVGYLYVTNSKAIPGLITAYGIDYQTGHLSQLADSPIPAGGNNTVTLVAAPSGKYIYIINHDTSDVVEASVGTDGKLYPENTYDVVTGSGVIGSYPTAAAIDPAGKFLYIIFTYQNGYTTVRPGPGGIAAFPINADGSLGTPLTNTTVGTTAATPLPYVPLGNNPVGLAIPKSGGYVYVIDQETTGGKLLAFAENTSTGALPVAGTAAGVTVGTTPSAIAEDPTGKFVYVTDSVTNLVNMFTVTAGVPSSAPISQIATGLGPDGITIDPRGKYLYVANYGSSTVSPYAINTTTGVLTTVVSTGVASNVNNGVLPVGTGPTCLTIDPAVGIYLYTSNFLNSSVSAAQLDPKTGALTQIQGTPFSSQIQPSCAVAVANGSATSQLAQ